MIDITEKDSFSGEEETKPIKFDGYLIRMAILLAGGSLTMNVIKTTTFGESKEHWKKLLLNADDYGLENIAVDTKCEYEDERLNLFPVEKDNNHHSNQYARLKISKFMDAIYRNLDIIRSLEVDNALRCIKELAEQQFENCRITMVFQ